MYSAFQFCRVKSDVLGEHLEDDPYELSGTMTKGCIVAAALSALQVVVFAKSIIIFDDVVRRVDQCVPQGSGAAFGHSGMAGIELAGLTDDGIQTGVSQELVVIGETVNVTDFSQDHSGFDITDAGDGHNDGAHGVDDLFDLGFVIINLSVQ